MGFLKTLANLANPVSSILNPISSLATSLVNRHSQKETNKANERINQENNAFNAEQAQLNRDFQAQQTQLAQEYNSKEAALARQSAQDFEREMFQAENEYNSPANQLKMLRDAGLNTNLVNPSLSSASASSTPAASASSSAPSGSVAQSSGNAHLNAPMLSNPDLNFKSAFLSMESLEQQVRKQKLENDDKERELEAKKTPTWAEYLHFETGSPESEMSQSDFYSQQRQLQTNELERSNYETQQQRINLFHKSYEYKMYVDTFDVLKQMTKEKLNLLKQDVQQAISNNSLLSEDVELMKKFGISSKDADGWQSLLKMSLRNPDAFSNVVDGLLRALESTGSKIVEHATSSPDVLLKYLMPVPKAAVDKVVERMKKSSKK